MFDFFMLFIHKLLLLGPIGIYQAIYLELLQESAGVWKYFEAW